MNVSSLPLIINLYSAGIDLRRQNLTSVDEVDPRTEKVKIFLMAVDIFQPIFVVSRESPNNLITIFTHLKLCLADAIHFK